VQVELDDASVAAFAAARPVAEELSPLCGEGLLVVHGGATDPALAPWLRGAPAVTVVVGDPGTTPPGFDVYLTDVRDPPRPWVSAPAAAVAEAVAAQPLVSLAAVYMAVRTLAGWRLS